MQLLCVAHPVVSPPHVLQTSCGETSSQLIVKLHRGESAEELCTEGAKVAWYKRVWGTNLAGMAKASTHILFRSHMDPQCFYSKKQFLV